MQPSIIKKLEEIKEKAAELSEQMARPEVVSDQKHFRELAKEFSAAEQVVAAFDGYQSTRTEITQLEEILRYDDDDEVRGLAKEELTTLKERAEREERELLLKLLPAEADDQCNLFLEIRAGAGGDEAAIFAGDLFRMYSRYIENAGWQIELISETPGEHGGFKEIIVRVIGYGCYARLKFESGVHRVQRVPETEAQGRIHTSTCTVAVLAEAEQITDKEINPSDIKIDTFRSSGAGGQHVNVTDSAIRITHIPTGIVVECQDERSQHKNKARAMSLLKAKLLAQERARQQERESATRRSLVGTGDRSERIRTYNFPQGRLTDHRINLTLYQLERIIDGDLDPVIEPLINEHNADRLSQLLG